MHTPAQTRHRVCPVPFEGFVFCALVALLFWRLERGAKVTRVVTTLASARTLGG